MSYEYFMSVGRAEVADKLPFVGDVEPLASLEAGKPYSTDLAGLKALQVIDV